MKYRFIKITDRTTMTGTDTISSKDIKQLKEGYIEQIIDLERMAFFNADINQWQDI